MIWDSVEENFKGYPLLYREFIIFRPEGLEEGDSIQEELIILTAI